MEKKDKVKRIVGIAVLAVLTVILLPILIVNLTLIIKSSINPDMPPDIFGTAPLAVMTDSMNGDEEDSFAGGALILVDLLDEEEKQDLTVGQIVTFRDTDENGDVFFVTHRIVELGKEGGSIAAVTTRGDANTGNDAPTDIADVLGVCTSSIGGLGGFAIFLQTPAGILVCVGIPVLAYIVYDVLRIYWNNRKAKADTVIDEKDAEIARLRALVEQQNGAAEAAFAPPEYGEGVPAEAQVFAEGAEGQALAEGMPADAEPLPENAPDAAPYADEMAAEEMAAYGDPAEGYAAFEGAEDAGQGAEEAPAEDMPAQEQSGEDKPGGEDAPLEEEER